MRPSTVSSRLGVTPTRSRVAALTVLLAAAALTGCSADNNRSVEAYCGVISDHKDRYVEAMAEVNSSDNLIAGLSGMVSALGDLNQMWSAAAKVAPDDIRADVEAVRDTWAAQFEAAEEMLSNPLGALASSLMAGLTNAAAVERVDAYTAQNCPDLGAMFGAVDTPLPEQPTPEPSEEPEPTPEPVQIISPEGSWVPFGPFLSEREPRPLALSGPVTLYVPEAGEVTIDASVLLWDEEVVDEQYVWVQDGDTPYLAGSVIIRVPASGLEPEGYMNVVLGIDVSAGNAKVVSRFDGTQRPARAPADLVGTSHGGVVVVRTGDVATPTLTGINVLTGEDVWSEFPFGLPYEPLPVDWAWVYSPNYDDACNTAQGSSRDELVLLNIVTGEKGWTLPTARPDLGLHSCQLVIPVATPSGTTRFAELRENYLPIGEVESYLAVDAITGTTSPISGVIVRIDPVGTSGLLAYPGSSSSADDDLVVVDLTNGQEIYRLEVDRVRALHLRDQAFFDGVLYVTTTDEQVAVDVVEGTELGTWTVYPITYVGDYVWLSDGTLRLGWSYDGE